MKFHYDQLLEQQNEMNIGLEPERVNKYRPEDQHFSTILMGKKRKFHLSQFTTNITTHSQAVGGLQILINFLLL